MMQDINTSLDRMLDYYREQGYDVDSRLEAMRDDEYRNQVIDKMLEK